MRMRAGHRRTRDDVPDRRRSLPASVPPVACCAIMAREEIAATTSRVLMNKPGAFASSLRWWRDRRGFSQLELAGRATTSQRHLSFLELGRAAPSREMVGQLAAALDLPLRQHNALLTAAGFAPVWRETDLSAPRSRARRAVPIDYMLAQQEPFPAVAVDRRWNLIQGQPGCCSAGRVSGRPAGPGCCRQPR